MNYDFSAIEKKWQKYWEENDTFHPMFGISPSPSIMCWICSRTPPVWVCTQAIRKAILQRISCPE